MCKSEKPIEIKRLAAALLREPVWQTITAVLSLCFNSALFSADISFSGALMALGMCD